MHEFDPQCLNDLSSSIDSFEGEFRDGQANNDKTRSTVESINEARRAVLEGEPKFSQAQAPYLLMASEIADLLPNQLPSELTIEDEYDKLERDPDTQQRFERLMEDFKIISLVQ